MRWIRITYFEKFIKAQNNQTNSKGNNLGDFEKVEVKAFRNKNQII